MRCQNTGKTTQKRGFAASVATHKRMDAALPNAKLHPAQDPRRMAIEAEMHITGSQGHTSIGELSASAIEIRG